MNAYFSSLQRLEHWALPVGLFFISFFILLILWKLVINHLRKLAARTQGDLDDKIVEWLNLPIKVGLFVISLRLSFDYVPAFAGSKRLIYVGTKLIFILTFTWLSARISSLALRSRLAISGIEETTRNFFANIIWVAVISIGALIALDAVGISITPIIASLGVGSLAVGLALQDTLSNFFSGIHLLLDKPFRLGDFVKVDSTIEGHVTKIGWRSTHIKLPSNSLVVVPNSKIASNQLTNFSMPESESGIALQVSVAYGSDLNLVERITIETTQKVVSTVAGGVDNVEPSVRFHTFADSSILFAVAFRTKTWTDQHLVKHELIKALHTAYNENGIEIPFPQRVVRLHQAQNPAT